MNRFFKQWLSWVFVLGACTLVMWQAYHPLWRPHLQVDVVTFHDRAERYWQNQSWGGLGINEYQPGALWFFAAIRFVARGDDFESFLFTLMLMNSVLILGHAYIMQRAGHRGSLWIFVLIVVAMGPILMHRFELLVSFFTILAWYGAQKKRFGLASFFLGLGCSVKVYPIILFPLVLAEAVRTKKFWNIIGTLVLFLMGLGLPLTAFVWWGGETAGIVDALQFHGNKPVGLEGIVGMVILVAQYGLSYPLNMTPGFGVHGFTPSISFLSSPVLNYLWVIPVGIFLAYVFLRFHKFVFSHAGIWFTLLLLFVISAKVMNPQYLWWFAVFLPLVMPNLEYHRLTVTVLVVLVVGTLVTTQYVYPIRYTEFLDWFNDQTKSLIPFVVLIVRNALLLVFTLAVLFGGANVRKRNAIAMTA